MSDFIPSPAGFESEESDGSELLKDIDWPASKETWIDQIKSEVLPCLTGDRRFPSSKQMAQRFERNVDRWCSGSDFRPVINDANELCAAVEILRYLGSTDWLSYEARLSGTPKSIDFCIEGADGRRSWIDMKTVAPVWQDDETGWARVQKTTSDLSANNTLYLDPDLAGAAIGRQLINTRWRFAQQAFELEAKIALLTDEERGPVRLLLCSDGSAWGERDLEDFIYYYFSGNFQVDDWASTTLNHYCAERNFTFKQSIAGFCYLERRHDEVVARKFAIDVRAPRRHF